MTMKVFLRSRATGLYWAGPDTWAATIEGAFDFMCMSQATRFALEQGLPQIELVLKYAGVADVVPVPLLTELDGPDRRAAA
jgi:hypothetical protein